MGKPDKVEFSKKLLIQESILIWINTIAMLILAFICVLFGYLGELPWLSIMVGLPWGAYGVSQMAYYRKAQAENTKDGIKFEAMLQDYLNEHPDDIVG
jgi:positive regulator of sigma E activity